MLNLNADAILLIASILSAEEIKRFTNIAHHLHMEVLLELHSEDEVKKMDEGVDVIGVNNRDLKTMKTDIQHSIRMKKLLPSEAVLVSESGIRDPEDIVLLREKGFHGFLIGSHFMKHSKPHEACKDFITRFKQLTRNHEG